MPRDLEALAAGEYRTLHDIHARTIVALHVEIAGGEPRGPALVEVARDRQRLEEHFGHDDRAAYIQNDATVVQRRERRRQPSKVPQAGIANRRAVGDRMLMHDFSA